MNKPPKRPRDLNQWAKRMTDIVSGEVEDRDYVDEHDGILKRTDKLPEEKARRKKN
jgi:hypothetical protein